MLTKVTWNPRWMFPKKEIHLDMLTLGFLRDLRAGSMDGHERGVS